MHDYLFCDDCKEVIENPIVRNYSDIGCELLCPYCKAGVGEISAIGLLEVFEGETDVPELIKELRWEYGEE